MLPDVIFIFISGLFLSDLHNFYLYFNKTILLPILNTVFTNKIIRIYSKTSVLLHPFYAKSSRSQFTPNIFNTKIHQINNNKKIKNLPPVLYTDSNLKNHLNPKLDYQDETFFAKSILFYYSTINITSSEKRGT